MTPPFIPVVESDESTAYFDPEFTSADVNADAAVGGVFDDEDPSENWVISASFTSSSVLHMPNGPLGSDVHVPTLHAVKGAQAAGLHAPAPVAPPPQPPVHRRVHDPNHQQNGNGQVQRPQHAPIQINTNKGAGRGRPAKGSPISSSVQEKFRGFSFTGESFVHGVDGKLAEEGREDEVEVIDADDLDAACDEWEDEEDAPAAGNGRVGETLIGVAPGTRKKGRKGGKSGVSSPLAAEEFDDGRAGGRVANTKKWNEMDDYL